MAAATKWHVRGTYFESCNCDPICPCRRIDGVAGGRSTHGICTGVLSWLIEEGAAAGTDLAGLAVALAIRYSDDEPGSPWSWVLYLDERGSAEQQKALEAIFTGRFGGDAETHFPWGSGSRATCSPCVRSRSSSILAGAGSCFASATTSPSGSATGTPAGKR